MVAVRLTNFVDEHCLNFGWFTHMAREMHGLQETTYVGWIDETFAENEIRLRHVGERFDQNLDADVLVESVRDELVVLQHRQIRLQIVDAFANLVLDVVLQFWQIVRVVSVWRETVLVDIGDTLSTLRIGMMTTDDRTVRAGSSGLPIDMQLWISIRNQKRFEAHRLPTFRYPATYVQG